MTGQALERVSSDVLKKVPPQNHEAEQAVLGGILLKNSILFNLIDLVGEDGREVGAEAGAKLLAARPPRPDLSPDPDLPADTRLWAALQQTAGGTWGGCVYDVDAIVAALRR